MANVLPAAPNMLDEQATMCHRVCRDLAVIFTDEQRPRLLDVPAKQLALGYESSSRSEIMITNDAPVG